MLEIALTSAEPLDVDTDLLLYACSEQELEAGASWAEADRKLAGLLKRTIGDERFRAKLGQTLVVHGHGGVSARRVGLVGLGSVASPDALVRALRGAAGAAVRLAASVGAARATLVWNGTTPDASAGIAAAAEGASLGRYRFDRYQTEEKSRAAPPLAALTLRPASLPEGRMSEQALERARSTARAVARARDLVNEPAGYMTPTRIAAVSREWNEGKTGASVEVFDRAGCQALGMGLFLAVAQGSTEEPRFIHVAWTPPSARRRVVLVGKGVTFDSGGLSLKTNDGMLDMKTDMAGAAAVLAAATAAAEEKLPVEVHALAACTENMPSGSSYKLGDVVRSLAGKTVEINNTDAEGRLTLADALSFGLRFNPDVILDFATLTGACMVALGPHTAGVMSNDDVLAASFLTAAERAGEEMWRLPLPPRLLEQLKSDVADFRNTGERWGGALTAGLFLKEFVGNVPWVHVDIAGPASASKEFGHVGKGGTGFAVASILEFLRLGAI
jgi:leucyl aminopeptidase